MVTVRRDGNNLSRQEAALDGRDGALLLLLNSLTVGGSERKTVQLANALKRRGRAVHVAYLNGPETLRASLDATVPVTGLRRRGRFSLSALTRLARYVARNRIERIVTVNLHPLLYAVPVARVLSRRPDVVALINTSTHRGAREQRLMRLYAPLLRRATRVVFGSTGQRETWIRDYALAEQRSVCILNGVDTASFATTQADYGGNAVRASLGLGAGDFVVGSVGALRPEKAFGDLLRAAAALAREGAPIKVLLVGDGPCRAALESGAEREGLAERAIFHGYTDDVRALLRAMDVFVLPSVRVETFSNAALEAMASSRAVVLSDIGGAREMIVPGESGLIYPPGDVATLTEALRRLHEHESLRQALAVGARARVDESFSFERMLADYDRWVFDSPARTVAPGCART